MPDWFAVHTRPRQELRALDHLQRQGFGCFLPRIRERVRRAGGVAAVVQPLFPRYLFVEIEFGRDDVAALRSTRGVVGPVRFGQHMPPVPLALIAGLQGEQAPDGVLARRPLGALEPGMTVAVQAGPLTGLTGRLLAVDARERVVVLLTLLGRETRVRLPQAALSPA